MWRIRQDQLRTNADRPCLAVAGVTTAQLGALFAVRDQPDNTQQRLAHTLGLDESAVTTLVTRLTEAGLLTEKAHPDQYRAVGLELIEAGEEALRTARPEITRFNTELRDLLGDEEFERTATAL